jgi:hypothetical protein
MLRKNTKLIESKDVTLANDDEVTTAHKVDEIEKQEIYLKPIRNPTNIEKRNMLAKSVEIMIIATLENHIYIFGNEIRRQTEGGPIGLALTGEIADCYMINWDERFLEILKTLYSHEVALGQAVGQAGHLLVALWQAVGQAGHHEVAMWQA